MTLVMAGLLIHVSSIISVCHAAPLMDETWYREHGVRVVNQPDAAPMSFRDSDGNPKGFVIDLWKEWSKATGIPVTFHFATWGTSFKGVASGEYDILGGLLFFPHRTQIVDFSRPYHGLRISLVVNANSDAPLETIASKYTVGMMDMGGSLPGPGTQLDRFKIRKYLTLKEVAQGLTKGEIQAAIGNYPILSYELKRLDSDTEILLKKVLQERPFHAAVAMGNTPLLDLVNKGLERIDADSYSKTRNKWFVPVSEGPTWIPSILMLLAGLCVVAALALFFFLRQRRIKE